jgi:hypothetical protein
VIALSDPIIEIGPFSLLRVEERCRVSDYMGIPPKSLDDVAIESGEFCLPLDRDSSSLHSIKLVKG